MTRRTVADIRACPRGHPYPESLRRTKNSCAVCHRESQSARYHRDPESSKKAASRWQKDNIDRRREYMASYREKNRDELRRYYRVYTQARRDAGASRKRRVELRMFNGDPCSWCNGPANELDHIQPVKHGGAEGWENRAAICRSCNASKKTRSLLTFLLVRAS